MFATDLIPGGVALKAVREPSAFPNVHSGMRNIKRYVLRRITPQHPVYTNFKHYPRLHHFGSSVPSRLAMHLRC